MSHDKRSTSPSKRRVLAFRVLVALTGLLFVAITLVHPAFAAPRNLSAVLDDTSILIMLALGQMLDTCPAK